MAAYKMRFALHRIVYYSNKIIVCGFSKGEGRKIDEKIAGYMLVRQVCTVKACIYNFSAIFFF